jgi:hypothetical protein
VNLRGFPGTHPETWLATRIWCNGQRREIIKQLEVRRSLAAFPFLQFILVRVDICE